MKIVPPRGRLLIYGCLALCVAAFFLLNEPMADGHFLSTWLEQHRTYGEARVVDDIAEAETAIRKIGPKAIPTLLANLRETDSKWKEKLADLSSKQSIINVKFTLAQDHWDDALFGFRVLGTQAVSAIPELTKMFFQSNTSERAAAALIHLGSAARPIFLSGLTNSEPRVRQCAIYGLLNHDWIKDLCEELKPLSQDSDPTVAAEAVFQLARCLPEEEALAVMRKGLKDSRPEVIRAALYSIRANTNSVPRLVPELVPLLNYSGGRISHTVTNALRAYAPAAAFSLGIDTNRAAGPTNSINSRGRRLIIQ